MIILHSSWTRANGGLGYVADMTESGLARKPYWATIFIMVRRLTRYESASRQFHTREAIATVVPASPGDGMKSFIHSDCGEHGTAA